MPRLRHYDHLGTVRAVNFSCYRRLRLLRGEREIQVMLEEIDNARDQHRIAILGYIIMPSHVHVIIYPPDAVELGFVIGQIKSRSGRRILESWRKLNHPVLSQLTIQRARRREPTPPKAEWATGRQRRSGPPVESGERSCLILNIYIDLQAYSTILSSLWAGNDWASPTSNFRMYY